MIAVAILSVASGSAAAQAPEFVNYKACMLTNARKYAKAGSIDEVIQIARSNCVEWSKQMRQRAEGDSKDPDVVNRIMELIDEEVIPPAIKVIGDRRLEG